MGTHAYSTVRLGTLGKIYLGGASGSLTTTSGKYKGTYTDTATSTKPHLTVAISARITVTHSGSTVGTRVKFTAGASGKLSGTTFTHCEITTLPPISFTQTGSVWKTTGNSLSSALIVSYGTGTCNGVTVLEAELVSARLSGAIKVS